MSECLVILVAVPALEESLVDWLLERAEIADFTSMPISAHNAAANEMSLHEQVSGRRRQVMFHVRLSMDVLEPVLAALRASFGGAQLEYWALPIVASGRM